MTTKNRGFTLIEMLVATVIIGLLAAASAITIQKSLQHSRDTRRKADLSIIADALEKYYANHRIYPTNNLLAVGACSTNICWFTSFQNPGELFYYWVYRQTYIKNIAPNYLAKLPLDPKFDPATEARGYMYHSTGSGYKVEAYNSVEAIDAVAINDEFYDVNSLKDDGAKKSFQISTTNDADAYWGWEGSEPPG